MNKQKVLITVFLLMLATITSAKDVLQLDVASVKLGMSPEEAITALKTKYKVADNQIQKFKFGGSPYKGNYISSIVLKQFNTKVRVTFGVVPPVNKAKPIKVENIEYSVPYTKENVVKLKQAAISKYGQPTAKRKHTGELEWCKKAGNVGGILGTTKGCSGLKPFLKLSLTTLQLFDPTRNFARANYKLKGKSANPKL